MVEINKAEKEIILGRYPNTHVVRTMKQDSRRHHYYMTEGYRQMNLLNKIRETGMAFKGKGVR